MLAVGKRGQNARDRGTRTPRAWGGNLEGEVVVILLPKINHIRQVYYTSPEYHTAEASSWDSVDEVWAKTYD